MPKLSKAGLKKRAEFIKMVGPEKAEKWLKDKEKRELINATCQALAD